MALSMEEQRILAEIEQALARSEPALAARLAAFGHPGRAALLRSARSPRALVVASLVALVLLTVLPVIVYALVPLRGLPRTVPARHPAVSAQHLTSVPR
jgi:hypothetical protein